MAKDPTTPTIEDYLTRNPTPVGGQQPNYQYPMGADPNNPRLGTSTTTPPPLPPSSPWPDTTQNSTDPNAQMGSTKTPANDPYGFGQGTNPAYGAPAGPAGIDPALLAIYQRAGITPGDRGSGFADWQYWQEKGPSQYARLTADLAGTGTDQPTGTPGTGPWSNSGRNQPTGSTGPGPGGSPYAGYNPGGVTTFSGPFAPGGGAAGGPGGGTGGYAPLDATSTMDPNAAVAYLNQINASLGGGQLSPSDIAQAAQLVGYDQSKNGPVSGTQLNQIVQEMYRRAGRPVPTSTASGPGPGSPSAPGSPSGAPTDANSLFSFLMSRANEGLDVNPNDPLIRGQVEPFQAAQDRSARNYVSEAAARGGANANLDAVSRSMAERSGQTTAQFEGQVMQHEVDARRQEIQQALQLGSNLLTEEQRQNLQLELEQLNERSQQFMQLRDLQERGFEFGTTAANQVALA